MKKFCLFTILFSALLFADVAAQEIQVKSFQKLERDLTARTRPRLDLNDNPCALIKIETTGRDFEFEGNVLLFTEKVKCRCMSLKAVAD